MNIANTHIACQSAVIRRCSCENLFQAINVMHVVRAPAGFTMTGMSRHCMSHHILAQLIHSCFASFALSTHLTRFESYSVALFEILHICTNCVDTVGEVHRRYMSNIVKNVSIRCEQAAARERLYERRLTLQQSRVLGSLVYLASCSISARC